MVKFAIPPDQSGYSVKDGLEVVATQLEGGAPKIRRDILGAVSRVNVTWIVDVDGYRYVKAFYKAITQSGALPFLIDLILDKPGLTEHTAYFVPDSIKLSQQRGNSYTVNAELYVTPEDVTQTDSDFVFIYNEFGDDWTELAEFDYMINVEMVFDIGGFVFDELSILQDEDGYYTIRN